MKTYVCIVQCLTFMVHLDSNSFFLCTIQKKKKNLCILFRSCEMCTKKINSISKAFLHCTLFFPFLNVIFLKSIFFFFFLKNTTLRPSTSRTSNSYSFSFFFASVFFVFSYFPDLKLKKYFLERFFEKFHQG